MCHCPNRAHFLVLIGACFGNDKNPGLCTLHVADQEQQAAFRFKHPVTLLSERVSHQGFSISPPYAFDTGRTFNRSAPAST